MPKSSWKPSRTLPTEDVFGEPYKLAKLAPTYALRYLGGGRVLHAIHRFFYDFDCDAICGAAPSFGGYWYGTGCQEEYERAAKLPDCKSCLRILILKRG
jgi:hypothetical protein